MVSTYLYVRSSNKPIYFSIYYWANITTHFLLSFSTSTSITVEGGEAWHYDPLVGSLHVDLWIITQY